MDEIRLSEDSRRQLAEELDAKEEAEEQARTAAAQEAAFVALAHAARDVMLRRGWHPERCELGWWVKIRNDCARDAEGEPLFWTDPFTALVEADKWYRENTE